MDYDNDIDDMIMTDESMEPLYQVYGVKAEKLEQPLEVRGKLRYEVLAATPHGRHLLILSLLERVNTYWEPRVMGKIQLYLPPSLQSVSQPSPAPEEAIMLAEIQDSEAGGHLTSAQVTHTFNTLVPLELWRQGTYEGLAMYCPYNSTHR